MDDPAQITQDPTWFAHRYVESNDAIQFRRLSREDHARATFATDAHLPADRPSMEFPRRAAFEAAPPAALLHFIFHSAFCCSTLLAKAFDRPGLSTSFKEPPILNDIVGWRRRGASGRDVAEVSDTAFRLLARPFEPSEAVIVKPSNIVNGLIRMWLTLRPDAKAILIHAPLPIFLTSVAKKGLDGRLWVRELLAGFRTDGLIQRLGFDDEALFAQTDLQIAALGWLAQQALFADLATDLGNRVRTIDSETLLDRPTEALVAAARHYGVRADEDHTAKTGAAIFGKNAKSGEAFGRKARTEEYAKARSAHAHELAKVVAWSEAVAASAGIRMKLPNALID